MGMVLLPVARNVGYPFRAKPSCCVWMLVAVPPFGLLFHGSCFVQERAMLTRCGPERFGLILQTVSINNVRLSHDPSIRPVCSGCDPWFALRVLGHGL